MPTKPAPTPTQESQPQALRAASFVARGLGGGNGAQRVTGCWVIDRTDPEPIANLERLLREHHQPGCAWGVMLGYELGACVEPKASPRAPCQDAFPLIVVQRLAGTIDPGHDDPDICNDRFAVGPLRSSMGRGGYTAAVRRALDYIGAGDVYQVNIAHHLAAPFHGCARALSDTLMSAARPRYGAAMTFAYQGMTHAVCSFSPELFLRYDPSSAVLRTEPMKGTRPIGCDERELEQSPKDRAELNMITDLMRNDIGRVCRAGSVRVLNPRRIEPHDSGVLQATAIIEGLVRDGTGIAELLNATFPPGSVTGAPKVRAMQIIDELECRPRGPYCGSMLHIDPSGRIEASVMIRTAHIRGISNPDFPERIVDKGRFVYPVGAGIVADSDPAGEWEETLVKAGVLSAALGLSLGDLG